MAARKKGTRVKTAARKGFARLERELPPTLRDYAREIRRQLNQLEQEVGKAQIAARRRAARLLREASYQLGHLEARGEANWRKLARSAQREVQRTLHRLEAAVSPPATRRPARRRTTARRAARPRRGAAMSA
jgi:hypothetical protein